MKSTLLITVVVLLALIYAAFLFVPPPLISPDELSYRFFAELLAREGTIFYYPEGDRIMGERGFLPRKFHYNVRGEVVSRKPPGLILTWAVFKKLAGKRFSPAFFPLLALAVLFLFYRLSRHIFPDRGVRTASLLLLASAPVFLLRSWAYCPTMLNLLIFFAALLFLQQIFIRGRWYHYLGTGLAAGIFVWVRQTSLLLWLPLGVWLFLERKKLKVSGLIWLGSGALGLLALYLIYNRLVFGNFLATSYTVLLLQPGDHSAAAGIRGFFRIVEFHPKIWLLHLVSSPLAFSLAFPPLVIGLVGFSMMIKEGYRRSWLYFWGLLSLILIAFFSNFQTYGIHHGELSLRSSFLRYCLPSLVFLPLGAAFFLSKLKNFFPAALAVLVAFNLLLALIAPQGLLQSVLLGDYYRQASKFILDNTDKNCVILSSYWDKLAFPERLVFSDLRDKDEDFLDNLLSRIGAKGYRAVYIDHYYDRNAFRSFLRGMEKGKISGPERLPGLLNWIKPPSDIYPVSIHELTLPGSRAM